MFLLRWLLSDFFWYRKRSGGKWYLVSQQSPYPAQWWSRSLPNEDQPWAHVLKTEDHGDER